MAFELRDRFETTDGSRPEVQSLAPEGARDLPLSAFGVLRGGDVFDPGAFRSPKVGPEVLADYLKHRVQIETHGAKEEEVLRVRADIERQLSGNPTLAARMMLAKPLRIDVLPPGASLVALGFPSAVSPRVAGLFWDRPEWDRARIALRQEQLAGRSGFGDSRNGPRDSLPGYERPRKRFDLSGVATQFWKSLRHG